MPDHEFEFDVAISFLAQDEGVALRLSAQLQDRFKTFVYSERQKDLAGRDGEAEFASAFGQKARVVVVLYRPKWGTTPWTRIEQDAIRNRAHEDGYDFTLWVPLEKVASMPAWLPKNRLWFNFERYGDAGLISVVEQLVQQCGGDTRPETLEDRAQRMHREVALSEARNELIHGNDIHTGRRVAAFAEDVSKHVSEWASSDAAPALDQKRSGSHTIRLISRRSGPPISLFIRWSQPYTNHVGDAARIHATMYRGVLPLTGEYVLDDPTMLRELRFRPDLKADGDLCWKLDDQEAELSPLGVADAIARFYMDGITEAAKNQR